MPIKAVATDGAKTCQPFILEVKVFSPQAGFRFHVIVEKSCTNQNDPLFALVFDLDKKIDDEFVQIVHVSFRPEQPKEAQGIEKMVNEKITKKQMQIAKEELFPVAAELEGSSGPTPAQKKKLRAAASKVATAEV